MKLSKAYSQYGADMGRPNNKTENMFHRIKFRLQRVPLNQGGYDSGGAYWGTGTPLYRAWGDGEFEVQNLWFRALDREDAKEHVRKEFPYATFYR